MKKAEGMIFDMDGTLYPLNQDGAPWADTKFGQMVQSNILTFIKNEFTLNEVEADSFLTDLRSRFGDEISQGLEFEQGVPRRRFFDSTWDLPAEGIVGPQPGLLSALSQLTVRCALLSAAPQIWMRRVTEELGVGGLFKKAFFDGESDVRKPLPEAFQQIADSWDLSADQIISIGDQEHTDILPAQRLGMMTVRISPIEVVSAADMVAPNVVAAITALQKEGIL